MSSRLSVVDLGCRLPDGTGLFSAVTVAFGMERTALVGPNGVGQDRGR